MTAHLLLATGGFSSGGFHYFWNDGAGIRWSGKFKTKEDAVRAIKKAGFGRYKYGEKTVSL